MIASNSALYENDLKILSSGGKMFGEYRGFSYFIERKLMGHICGYVFIPKMKKTLSYYEDKINVHGGITYVDNEKIGFDSMHYYDWNPFMNHEDHEDEYYKTNYKDSNFMIDECKKIINQLIEQR
jgi:hypothetical protein